MTSTSLLPDRQPEFSTEDLIVMGRVELSPEEQVVMDSLPEMSEMDSLRRSAEGAMSLLLRYSEGEQYRETAARDVAEFVRAAVLQGKEHEIISFGRALDNIANKDKDPTRLGPSSYQLSVALSSVAHHFEKGGWPTRTELRERLGIHDRKRAPSTLSTVLKGLGLNEEIRD